MLACEANVLKDIETLCGMKTVVENFDNENETVRKDTSTIYELINGLVKKQVFVGRN
jgi:hypothetical protein